jgi:hypothetical protein
MRVTITIVIYVACYLIDENPPYLVDDESWSFETGYFQVLEDHVAMGMS